LPALVLLAWPLTASAQDASIQEIAGSCTLPKVVIYPARDVITLDPAKPSVQAVAVVGDRIAGAFWRASIW
jgi:hypothetical protein